MLSHQLNGDEEEKKKQLDGFKVYPSLRDHPLKTAAQWLRGRRMDDKLDGLWRVHDKLYDLTSFLDRHPGGRQWLELTKGTDITEAFESSHISPSVSTLLDKFYVKPAATERISPYTFEPKGFYVTLRRRVHEKLSSLPADKKMAGRQRVVKIQNVLLVSFAFLLTLTGLTGSYWAALAAGAVLFLNINCAHNFYHQKNNWRMFAWDLGLLSSNEWRVTHGISHHGYTNSILDFELSDFEPIYDFRVYRKSPIQRYFGLVVTFLTIQQLFFFQEGVKRIFTILLGYQKLRPENLLPLVELAFLYALTDRAFGLWMAVQGMASFLFGFIGLIAAHHHPDLYHSGDGKLQLGTDWGLAQLDAVRDRNDVEGNLLAELTMYGNHILHHLFPTLDHGLLDDIRPVFQETCKEFHVPVELWATPSYLNQWDLALGLFQQLARTEPRSSPFKKAN